MGEIAVCPAPITTLKNRRFQRCFMKQTWSDIIRAQNSMNPEIAHRYATGGLGKLMTEGQYETWLCDGAHSCAEPTCLFYENEVQKCFMSSGFNQQSQEDVCSSYAQVYQCLGQQGCCERFNEIFHEINQFLNSELNCNIVPACEEKENDMMCYTYNEESQEFEPLDLNSNLNLVKKPRGRRAVVNSSAGNNDKSSQFYEMRHKNHLGHRFSSMKETMKRMADSDEDSKQIYKSLYFDLLPDVVKVHLQRHSSSSRSKSKKRTDDSKSSKRQWVGSWLLQDWTNVKFSQQSQHSLDGHAEFEGSWKGIKDKMLSRYRKKVDAKRKAWVLEAAASAVDRKGLTDKMLTGEAEETSVGQDSAGEQQVLLISIDFIY